MDPASEIRPTGCPCGPASAVPIAATKNIEDQEWYHGFRPLSDFTRSFTKPGEFMVRATMSGLDTIYVITAMMCNKEVVHIPLSKNTDGCWFISPGEYCKDIDRMAFSSITDLINYYRINPFSTHLKCEKIICRPPWWVKSADIAYDEAKNRLGSSGQYFKGTWKRKDGETVVVIKKPIMAADSATEEEKQKANASSVALMKEARHTTSFKHDNVVLCMGVAYDRVPITLLTEFCAGGSLLRHLTSYGKDTDVKEKYMYIYEAAVALSYLKHARCIVRNVCTRNCLISTAGRIKIGNFAYTTNKYNMEDGIPDEPLLSYIKNNARYCAPEAFGTPVPLQFSFKSDVWSFGMIVYEVFSNGVKPWPEINEDITDVDHNEIAAKIRKGEMPTLPEGTPSKLVDLVGRIWKMSPAQRLAIADVALALHATVKEICKGHDFTNEPMAVNKIHGVNRESYFDFADTFDLEPSSGPSTDVADGKRILSGQ